MASNNYYASFTGEVDTTTQQCEPILNKSQLEQKQEEIYNGDNLAIAGFSNDWNPNYNGK